MALEQPLGIEYDPDNLPLDPIQADTRTYPLTPTETDLTGLLGEIERIAFRNGSPLVPSAERYYTPNHAHKGVQVIALKPIDGVTTLPASDFDLIAETQFQCLDLLKGVDLDVAFIPVAQNVSISSVSDLNIQNYWKIANKLPEYPNFKAQVMVLNSAIMRTAMSKGVATIGVFMRNIRGMYMVAQNYDEALGKLNAKFDQP